MKGSNFLKRKSSGQHILELALMMPFFIIIFGYAFQIMVETYVKYKFSYIFTNSVRQTVENQPIFTSLADSAGYNIREAAEQAVLHGLFGGNAAPYSDVQIGTISTDKAVYIIGAFQYMTKMLFSGNRGKEYFYFIVPVNSTYTVPLVLNHTEADIDTYFKNYYSLTGNRYFYTTSEAEGMSLNTINLYSSNREITGALGQ